MSLKHTKGRVVIEIDLEFKNSHKFSDGTVIRLERDYENFNKRETQPVNAIVISAEHIPVGSEILISHNALHEVNLINDYKKLSGKQQASGIRYYSLPETDCFAWRNSQGELCPMKNFAFALRVFEPYKGVLQGIEPQLIKNVLYITTGEFSGNVCHVLKASDYEIVFQGQNGREERIVRCRHFEDDYNEREEIVAVDHELTDKLNNGGILIGLTPTDCKNIFEYYDIKVKIHAN